MTKWIAIPPNKGDDTTAWVDLDDDVDESNLFPHVLAEVYALKGLSAYENAVEIASALSERDKLRDENARLRAALKRIADGDAGDQQSFEWPEFYASIRNEAREAVAAPSEGDDRG